MSKARHKAPRRPLPPHKPRCGGALDGVQAEGGEAEKPAGDEKGAVCAKGLHKGARQCRHHKADHA